KSLDAVHRLAPARVLRAIVADSQVHACQRPQFLDPMRVGHKAHVEHQVGGSRHAARKAEGGNCDDWLIAVLAVASAQFLTQFNGREIGGVKHAVGRLAEKGSDAALAGDSVFGRTVSSEGMAASSLIIAADELHPRTVEIEDFRPHALD